jgi:hypothetical protein
MSYRVVAVHDDAVEVWDGESKVDPDWPGERSTQTYTVGRPHAFQVDDVVDVVVVLKHRPPPKEENT